MNIVSMLIVCCADGNEHFHVFKHSNNKRPFLALRIIFVMITAYVIDYI